MEKEILKELLRNIKENNYQVPDGTSPFELSLDIMDHIGDTDAELRDNLGLSVLTNWMIKDILVPEEIKKILDISLNNNHLLYGIGSIDDSVLTRTFSVLIVAAGIYKHREHNYLTKDEVMSAFEKVLTFYNEDNDVRGYIDGKGWAHGAAHGADALDEFVRCDEIDYKGLSNILDSIYAKIGNVKYGYIHEEDERIVTVIIGILGRNILEEDEIIGFLNQFGNIKKTGNPEEDLVRKMNVRNFMRSLYFRLKHEEEYIAIFRGVEKLIDNMRFSC